MNESRQNISKNIRKYRLRAKMTQEKLAEKAGIDYKYIQRLEGKTPPNMQVNTLDKIAKSLNTTPDKLLLNS